MKLFLKGERCHTEKCAIEKRNFVPGQHGKDRKPKIVGYGLQLREKQKARRYLRLAGRRSSATCSRKPAQMKGITGENLLGMLERRLDNVVYRMGFGTSRAAGAPGGPPRPHPGERPQGATSLRSMVKLNDVVEVREKSRKQPGHPGRARRHGARADARTGWKSTAKPCRARVLAHAQARRLVQIQMNEQLIVELYSK